MMLKTMGIIFDKYKESYASSCQDILSEFGKRNSDIEAMRNNIDVLVSLHQYKTYRHK